MISKKLTTLLLEHSFISTQLSKKMDSLLSFHGLSFTEFVIMHKLNTTKGGSLSRINLAESVGLTASGVTRLLAPMEKNNIIEKIINPRDARQSLVMLTSTGEELTKYALVSAEEGCKSIFSLLSEEELNQLTVLLNKIKC